MLLWISIFSVIFFLYLGALFLFSFLDTKIRKFEYRLIELFTSRTDIIPALFEVSKPILSRHTEIFSESILLRKKEFSLMSISQKLESFLELEAKIHHEINFIFQVCNKNPKLNSEKTFLYIRDIILIQSVQIGREFKKYNKVILAYNKLIKIKNYTLIGYFIPYTKKTVL